MVPQVVVPTNGLETLLARPPTPPRENTNGLQILALPSLDPRRSLHTPPNYSSDASNLSDPISKRTRKKVGFSSQAEYRDASTYAEDAKRRATPVSASSTASLHRTIKSILKPSPPVVVNPLDPCSDTDEATRYANLATMLDSTIKQLAGADRDSRLDAYMMLVRALKASNNLPDRIALQDKMSLFTQFIQRDITTRTMAGVLDSSLTNHALTLLSTFLHFPAIALTLSNDFGVFIIEHCIKSFEDSSVPKDLARHLMQVVASQNFPPKVMTSDRVGRLVKALHEIEDHLKGKSIIMSRILIYRRLIQQSKVHMITHSDWLLDLFTDMLSSIREIRETAIALGLEVSFTIGKEKQLLRKVMDVLQMGGEEAKYIEFYINKLKTMARDRQFSASVPQVWSVVSLLMRCPIEKWEFFGPWLEIIQLCFNTTDFPTKFEANYAWNRLVYAMQLNEASFLRNINILCQPFLSQLKRKAGGKHTEELRKVVVGSICNLYYYAFKPNTSHSQLDTLWDGCVSPIMRRIVATETDGKMSDKSLAGIQDNAHQAILILTGLFDSSTRRQWKEEHVAETPLVRPDQLPALNSKWVRKNAPKVFDVVEPLLSKTFMDLSDVTSDSYKLWQSLVNAVAFAASKEVKVSTDTAVFMANAFTFLARVWSCGYQEPVANERGKFFSATRHFITIMIDSLGLLPFTEKQLCMGTQNIFIPVATPSHRPGKTQGVTRTPLHHLFSILSSLPSGTADGEELADLIRAIFHPFFAAKSARAKVDLAYEMMQSIPMDSLSPYGPWLIVSEIISSPLENSQASYPSTSSSNEPPVGHEYREIVRHLERGLRSTPNLPWEYWHSLFQALASRAAEETGDAGCAIAAIEPLAKVVLDILSNDYEANISSSLFKCGIDLISNAKQPRDRQALDAGRRRLWGTSVAGSRSASFDPFDNLYRLTNHLLDVSYRQYDASETEEAVVPLLTEVAGFLTRCNKLLVCKALINMQDSIGLWIQDSNERYNSVHSPNVSQAVKILWDRVCYVFTHAGNLDQVQLDAIEPLLCAAFESKHRHVVNSVTTAWNRAFDQVDEVQYPKRLKAVLLSLRPYVDILLPGLDLSNHESIGRQPSFIESEEFAEGMNPSGNDGTPQPQSSTKSSATHGLANIPNSTKRRSKTKVEVSRTRSSRRSGTPRLRHDNSQIQFAAIESSSPLSNDAASQVLTDRQKEVRERQLENAALFSGIRSSAQKSQAKSPLPFQDDTAKQSDDDRAITPKTHRSFEDYVSSTPTPRRGQAPAIEDNDHEMTDDVPSSPPELRRYPLLPNINKPHPSSSSVLDDWGFVSSPISGSPLQNRQMPSKEQKRVEKDMGGSAMVGQTELPTTTLTRSGDAGENGDVEGIEGQFEAAILQAATNVPETPSHPRFLKAQETPKSDHDVYVDALTSPRPQSPRNPQSLAKKAHAASTKKQQDVAQSFEASDVDERSMLRLVVELDSRKCDPMPPYGDPGNPEKPPECSGSPVLDCITVDTGSKENQHKPSKGKTVELSSSLLPTSMDVDCSQPSSRKSKKKRKRAWERSQESGSKKRRHLEDSEVDIDVVPGSQLPSVHDKTFSNQSESSGEEVLSNSSQESSNQEHEIEEGGSDRLLFGDRPEDDSEAVNRQLDHESSQNNDEMEHIVEVAPAKPLKAKLPLEPTEVVDITMKEVPEKENAVAHVADAAVQTSEEITVTPEKPSVEKIMDALRGGLEELCTSSLSRDDVYKVEGMFMDIKRELYEAESRGRN